MWEFMKEGFMIFFVLFMVIWIIFYIVIYYDWWCIVFKCFLFSLKDFFDYSIGIWLLGNFSFLEFGRFVFFGLWISVLGISVFCKGCDLKFFKNYLFLGKYFWIYLLLIIFFWILLSNSYYLLSGVVI